MPPKKAESKTPQKPTKKATTKDPPKQQKKTGAKAKDAPTVEDFTPLHRQDNIAAWRRQPDAIDYSVSDTAINTPDTGSDIKANLAKWKDVGHRTGIQVLHKWETLPKGQTAIAGYNGMNDKTLLNFVDTVVCDIVPKGLVCMATKFKHSTAKELISDESELEDKIPRHMEAIFSTSRSSVNDLSDEGKAQNLIGPDELVNEYMEDRKVKSLIDKIIKGLSFPIFLPITASMVGREEGEEIDVVATILAQAVQILLFAPTEWNKDIEYCRPDPDYTLRYPTPDGHGGNCRSVAGTFSLEDLHRSIVLLYLALYRRTATGTSIHSTRAPAPRDTFSGYFDVERQKPMPGADDEEGPTQSAAKRRLLNPMPQLETPSEEEEDLDTARMSIGHEPSDEPRQTTEQPRTETNATSAGYDKWIELQSLYMECDALLAHLRNHYRWGNLEDAHAKIAKQVTTFSKLVDEQQMVEFSDVGAAAEAIQQVLAERPEEEEALNQAIRRAYALEMIFNGQPPPENTDIDAICSRFDIEQWPSLKLYPDANIEPLKPHQVADIGVIFDKLDTLGHVFLSNEMGLGKTKVFAATIECRARELERLDRDSAKKVKRFFPTLIVNPVSTVHQTHRELKANFPGLTILLYYASKSQSKRFNGATVLDKSEFEKRIRNLSPTNPESARTVVVTTYSTLHHREVVRRERKFVILERRQKSKKSKRSRRTAREHDSASESDDSEAEGDWMDVSEMVKAKLKKPPNALKRVTRYTSEKDPELCGKRLHFLTENDRVQPDGNIVQYKLKRPSLGEIRWGMLIVDEAHMARRLDGIFNHTFRLLNWKHLIWVTGTPLMSGLQDILSPLSLMWNKMSIDLPGLWSDEIGHMEGLWSEEYDPFEEETIFDDGTRTRGILTDSFMAKHPSQDWAKVKQVYYRTDIRLWQIDPSLVERVGRAADWSTTFGKKVVSAVLRTVSLRRTLRSRLLLPDGNISFPVADLLPMVISTEELNFDKSRQALVQKHGRDAANNSFSGVSDALPEYTASSQGLVSSDREASINFGAYREGILVAYDSRNIKVLYQPVDHIFGKDSDNLTKALVNMRDSHSFTQRELQRLQRRATKDDAPTVGVEHLQKLLGFDNNAGLDYFFSRACLDPDVHAPAGRLGWLTWLTATSPILARTLELCHNHVHKNQQRVVIYIDTPWIQQIMYAALLMAGFNTLTVRSSDKPGAKIESIRLFADPTSDAEVFVVNINIMSTGVNLHSACATGIIANLHFNAKTLLQIHGRLNRLGQTHQVRWYNLKVKNSFHDHQDRVMLTKWARQLSAECNLPSWLDGALREIVVLWDRDGGKMAYYSVEARKLGMLLSAVAKVVLNTERPPAFWQQNNDWVVIGLLAMVNEHSMEKMQAWLAYEEGRLRKALEEKLARSIRTVRVKLEETEQAARLNLQVEARKHQRLSEEFIRPGDSDLEDDEMDELERDDDGVDEGDDLDGDSAPSDDEVDI
ncbi:hypothetical protein V8C42DRAFT_356270 [Trichoderma barbatum]